MGWIKQEFTHDCRLPDLQYDNNLYRLAPGSIYKCDKCKIYYVYTIDKNSIYPKKWIKLGTREECAKLRLNNQITAEQYKAITKVRFLFF